MNLNNRIHLRNHKQTKLKNQEFINRLIRNIELNRPEEVSVGIVGSDARLENRLISPIECVLIFEDLKNQENIKISDEIKNAIHKRFDETTIQENPFYMNLSEDTELFSPARLLDYTHIKGNPELYKKRLELAKKILMTPEGKKILIRSKNMTRAHSKIMESGKQKYRGELLNHYDLDQGLATYDPQKNLWGVKQGPNRLIQFSITRDLLKLTRDNKICTQSLINIPRNTVDKLDYMHQAKLLNLSDLERSDLANNYIHFTELYHKSQEEHKKGNKIIVFDVKEMKERLKSIKRIYDQHSYFVKT